MALLRTTTQFQNRDLSGSVNMTAVIDIVFLLILFFLVIFRFIEAENFSVTVPDECRFAQQDETFSGGVTVTVMKSGRQSDFAVGSQEISSGNYRQRVGKMAGLINAHFENMPAEQRIVTLRIDKDICFADAQYALAAVADSGATDVHLATMKQKHSK